MTAKIIDGTAIGKKVRENVRQKVAIRVERGFRAPHLAVILVGDDPASHVYVGHKEKACHQVGIKSSTFRLPASTKQEDVLRLIADLNTSKDVDGILPQLPMPSQIDRRTLIEAIDPKKDVDGLSYVNQGMLNWNVPALYPCTAAGVLQILKEEEIQISGKRAVVIGRSLLVGLPALLLLTHAGATTTCIHSKTVNPESICREADILVAAAGVKHLVRDHWVKPGAVVVDVGIHRTEEGRLTGDVEFEGVSKIASHITPVPGGVGPLTIAMLMQNCLFAFERSQT
jgi:methylenetetrahydrofolate dehydrogenase (NADP+)/methenyltetrahydrofolate cyclohydrolase